MKTTTTRFPACTESKLQFKPYTRFIANSKEIRDASVTLEQSGSERWGEFIIITQYLQKMGSGNWIDCYSLDEFFEKSDAIEHARDKVAWLTDRSSTFSKDEPDEDDSDLAPRDYSSGGGM